MYQNEWLVTLKGAEYLIIYVVKNHDYVVDYFVEKHNAEAEMEKVNELCEEFKNHPNVNSKPVFIEELKTAD